jgi:fibronectin type 3 domain-containing protein
VIASYRVYRGTVSGGLYTLLNTIPSSATSYTDANVASGTTYFYVVVSVTSLGIGGDYSNEVKAVIPSP